MRTARLLTRKGGRFFQCTPFTEPHSLHSNPLHGTPPSCNALHGIPLPGTPLHGTPSVSWHHSPCEQTNTSENIAIPATSFASGNKSAVHLWATTFYIWCHTMIYKRLLQISSATHLFADASSALMSRNDFSVRQTFEFFAKAPNWQY